MAGTVIVGYDGSEGGNAALSEAITLASVLSADLTIVFAYEKVVVGGESHDLDEAVEEIGERILAEASATASGAGISFTTQYVEGPAAESLALVAERENASYVVVGGTTERPLKAWVLGSTANKLMAIAECPVVVVRIP